MTEQTLQDAAQTAPRGQAATSGLEAIYRRLAKPDRSLDADLHKKPTLAGVLSLIVPGLGQLYNTQLFKGLGFLVLTTLAMVLMGIISLSLFWPFDAAQEGWQGATGRGLGRLWIALPVLAVGLWLVSIVEAFGTARRLRSGKLIVRYGFKKQAALIAAGAVPLAGALMPEETCTVDSLDRDLKDEFQSKMIRSLIARKIRRLYMLGLLAVGVLPIVLGVTMAWPVLVVIGSLVLLWAIVGLIL